MEESTGILDPPPIFDISHDNNGYVVDEHAVILSDDENDDAELDNAFEDMDMFHVSSSNCLEDRINTNDDIGNTTFNPSDNATIIHDDDISTYFINNHSFDNSNDDKHIANSDKMENANRHGTVVENTDVKDYSIENASNNSPENDCTVKEEAFVIETAQMSTVVKAEQGKDNMVTTECMNDPDFILISNLDTSNINPSDSIHSHSLISDANNSTVSTSNSSSAPIEARVELETDSDDEDTMESSVSATNSPEHEFVFIEYDIVSFPDSDSNTNIVKSFSIILKSKTDKETHNDTASKTTSKTVNETVGETGSDIVSETIASHQNIEEKTCQASLTDNTIINASRDQANNSTNSSSNHFPVEKFQCDLCAMIKDSKKNLANHLKIFHGVTDPYACSECNYRATCESDVRNHLMIHTAENIFACSRCNFQASWESHLKKHTQVWHSDPTTKLRCSKCGFETTEKLHLSGHMLIHNNDKKHACDKCDYRTAMKINLKRHLFSHGKMAKFACAMCNYTTDIKMKLHQHEISHSTAGTETSACKMNDNPLLQHSNLALRLPESIYMCPLCHLVFRSKFPMLRHMQLHVKVGTIKKCSKCDFQTLDHNALQAHKRTHVGPQNCVCPLCDYKTNKIGNLKSHLLKHARAAEKKGVKWLGFQLGRKAGEQTYDI